MKLASFSLLVFPFLAANAQTNLGSGTANQLYQMDCASCHGGAWEGGKGGSLLRERWKYFTGDESQGMAGIIARGIPEMGMPPSAGKMSADDIYSLVKFIQSRRQIDREMLAKQAPPDENQTYRAEPYAFKLETITKSPNEVWAVAFLPDGRMLYTEKQGELHITDPAHPGTDLRIIGTPAVWDYGLGGLLDVAVHPEFDKNGWIYLSYTESRTSWMGRSSGMIAVVRGRIHDGRWIDQQDIFRLPDKFFSSSGDHLGCRIVIKDGFVFFSIGDRGQSVSAQNLASPNGKIFRVADDGKIPEDNPFPKGEGSLAAIWCYGSRNAEGLAFQPGSGVLWESEHGPRGGDEINILESGKNYGWPIVSYGIEDHGGPPTSEIPRPGMEQPKHHWTPAIAVSGIAFYEGEKFPLWKASLFVGGLRSQELHRLTLKDRSVVDDQIVLDGEGRVRDVVSGPDGTLYLVFNFLRGDGSRIARMVPANP